MFLTKLLIKCRSLKKQKGFIKNDELDYRPFSKQPIIIVQCSIKSKLLLPYHMYKME